VAEFDLNLSTRPFPAYRLINVALATILAVLFALSVWQAIGFTRYSRLARLTRAAEIEARVEAGTLGRRVAELETPLDRPEATAKLNEIGFLNRLISRKSLSWTRLLADLEEMVPNNVHLTSLTPTFGVAGGIMLQIELQGRSIAAASEFINRLEKSRVFQNITVSTEQKHITPSSSPTSALSSSSSDVDIRLTAVYLPEREIQ
jgi:type IV pilus assembly protein PilN